MNIQRFNLFTAHSHFMMMLKKMDIEIGKWVENLLDHIENEYHSNSVNDNSCYE